MHTSLQARSRKHALPPLQFTRREAEILYWIGEGKTDWEIGVILRLKRKTVNYYAGRLMRKFGAPTRMQMVRQAVRVGLLDV